MHTKMSFSNWMPEVTPIDPVDAGYVDIDKTGPFIAGSYQRFTLVYTVGKYGIDDTGSLKICYRFASDMGHPQFEDPTKPNWVSVAASNGATLAVRFDYKQNTRPWDRTIYVKIVSGFMREGDTLMVSFGTDERGPGMRMQTFIDPNFCFRVLVDPIATYTYVEVPGVPELPIVPGQPHRWRATVPTARVVGEEFTLNIRADDVWGNPVVHDRDLELTLNAVGPIDGLPKTVAIRSGTGPLRLSGLRCTAIGEISVGVSQLGEVLVHSNPLVVKERMDLKPYWGDLHAQSGETIGSGSALDYMLFARDCAFLDIVGHQGNDFQITQEFWNSLNGLMAKWNRPGEFVTIPGYEWSGNTALGGDRNVFYRSEAQQIRRSSHALVADRSDIETDCWDAKALFEALEPEAQDTVVWAHCGGRYADILYAHDHNIERSVEIHSSWGTFEWLAADVFEAGYRVGIVANSDGHKGRPGAEPPGASMFGALGGLTCYWMTELTRDATFDALKARHHYGTTGSRLHLMTEVNLASEQTFWLDDPRVKSARSYRANKAIMGDIVETSDESVEFAIELSAGSPILSLEIRRGQEKLEVLRPNAGLPAFPRYRIIWTGAEYRGRARQTVWDGGLKIDGAKIVSTEAINFLNPDRPLRQISETEIAWGSITTGNTAGVDLVLDAMGGVIHFDTKLGAFDINLSDVGDEPLVRDFGKLGRQISISRQPEHYEVSSINLSRKVKLNEGDNPLWVCASFADGHQAWSSPIYFLKKAL